MSNGQSNKAFDAMNAAIAQDDVDLTEDGEVSAWFPTGKFLGMKIPKGTAGIVEGLVFLAAASPGPRATIALRNKIKSEVWSRYMPPKMQEKVLGTAADQMKYIKRLEEMATKVAKRPPRKYAPGIEELTKAKKIFETAVREAPPGIAKDNALKYIARDKAVSEFAKKHGVRLAKMDKIKVSRTKTIRHPGTRALSREKEFDVYRKKLSSLPKAAHEKVYSPSRLKKYLEEFKYVEATKLDAVQYKKSGARQLVESVGKFSIPSLLDELED